MATRLIAGCMTGTSLDALDAALVQIEGEGLAMTPRFVRGLSRPLGELGPALRRLAEQQPLSAGEIATLALRFAHLHADALRDLAGTDRLDLVAVHGQTVYHRPPASWQLLQPAPIARAVRAPVVYDMRQADLAAGGQGAPITPLADWAFFRGLAPVAIANLGGFCNITLVPTADPQAVRGADVCACNQLLDALARTLLGAPYDQDGRHASAGHIHEDALLDLDGVLLAQAGSKRSLGTGDETGEWISRWRAHVPGPDLAATACEAVAQRIADATRDAPTLLLAGGGVRNAALVRALRSCSASRVEPIDARGLPAEYREAAAMAVLGALCRDRVPITLPAVTRLPAGVSAPLSGCWCEP